MRVAMLGLAVVGFSAPGQGSERSAALINSFSVMCLVEPLDFAQTDAKAAAMRLPVRKELRSPPDPSGGFVHSKSWLLPLKSGAHEFTVAQARGAKGEVKSCGIGAPDVGGDEFKAQLVKDLKPGRPVSETASPDRTQRITVWRYGREGLKLMLTDGSPKAQPGIYLIVMQEPSAR